MYTNIIHTPAQQIARLKKGGGRSFSKAKRPFQFFVKTFRVYTPVATPTNVLKWILKMMGLGKGDSVVVEFLGSKCRASGPSDLDE